MIPLSNKNVKVKMEIYIKYVSSLTVQNNYIDLGKHDF